MQAKRREYPSNVPRRADFKTKTKLSILRKIAQFAAVVFSEDSRSRWPNWTCSRTTSRRFHMG